MEEAHRIEVIHDYVRYCVETKDVKVTTFHHKNHPYSRKQSTIDLINRAKERKIIFPPRILCLQDTEAHLIGYKNVPVINLYKEKKNDPEVYLVTALSGAHSLIYFRKGPKNLTFVACTTPSYPAQIHFDEIDITTYPKGVLPEMSSPKTWDDLDWKIYMERNDPTESSVKIGEKLGVTCRTVLTRFKKILEDCQIWIPFFPNGYANYVPYIVTLRTEYETGILHELKKLDRSSYVYKADGTLILTLFFDRRLEIDGFLELHEKGLIHDVCVSYPLKSYSKFW